MELDIEHLKSRILLQQGSSHKCQSWMSATTNLSILKRPEKNVKIKGLMCQVQIKTPKTKRTEFKELCFKNKGSQSRMM